MTAADTPTAVVLGSPEYTESALQAASALGLELPRELSMVCYGDRPWYAFAVPALTTIRLPENHIAERCSKLAFNASDNAAAVQPELVVRGSTTAVR